MDFAFGPGHRPIWLLLSIALVPAVAGWVTDRSLRRAASEPTLPERLVQRQHRLAVITGLAGASLLILGWQASWALVVMWIGLQATTHRTRRWLFGDTASLATQVAWNLRALLGLLGFWWLAALTPLVAVLTGMSWLAVLLGLLLLVWNHFYATVAVFVLGATPLDRPSLASALEAVLARTSIRRPRLLRAGPRGVLVANAFALHDTNGNAVLFLDGLLDHLPAEEVAAILAHEVAHLEDFSTRPRGLYAVGASVAVGAAIVPIVAAVSSLSPFAVAVAWILVTFGTLIVRAIRAQQHETASDARAVALCGDGEALVRALTSLHALARLPRRFAADVERHATHPSLARRIQAIRAVSGVAPARIDACVFPDAAAGRAVIFEAERLVFVSMDGPADSWDRTALLERASRLEAVRYADLVEMRLAPGREGRATLVAVDAGGTARDAVIAAAEVIQAQALMDRVDQRLAPVKADVRGTRGWGQLAAFCAFIGALAPTPAVPVLFMTALALFRPNPPLLAAAGTSALVAAALRVRQADPPPVFVAALVAGGVACLLAAWAEWRRQPAPSPGRSRSVPAELTLAALTLLALVPLALIGWLAWTQPLDLHAAARALPAAATATAGLAACLFARGGRGGRLAASAAACASLGTIAAGSIPVRDAFFPDPLIARAPALRIAPFEARPLARASVRGDFDDVSLGPEARYALLVPAAFRTGTAAPVVADFAGWHRVVEATHAAFAGGDRLFTARADGRNWVLAVETIREGRQTWSIRVEADPNGAIEIDPATGRWRLEIGAPEDVGGYRMGERLEGRMGDPGVARTLLKALPPVEGYTYAVEHGTNANGTGIGLAYHASAPVPFVRTLVLGGYWSETALVRTGPPAPTLLARTRLDLGCVRPSLGSPIATCLARARDETFVWDVDADNGRLVPLAVASGALVADHGGNEAILAGHDGRWLLLWRGTPNATSLSGVEEASALRDADYRDGRLATLTESGDGTQVTLYPLTAPATAPDRTRSARRR